MGADPRPRPALRRPRPAVRRPAVRRAVVAVAALATLAGPVLPSRAGNLPQIWYQGASLPAGFTPSWDAASAAFPPLRRVILFGGAPARLGHGWRNDTWVYSSDTGKWTKGAAAPPGLTPRGGAAMAYDPAIGKIVMFGGAGTTWPPSAQTWLYDGVSWAPGPAAPAAMGGRVGARMAYDDAIGKLVLFGGAGAKAYADTWLFDGTKWTAGPSSPPGLAPRAFFGMTYDAALRRIVVAGGDGGTDTWLFDGSSWSPGPAMPPTQTTRERTRLVFDPQLGGDLMFGGVGPDPSNTSLWLLKDGAWSTLTMHPNPKPVARIDPQMVWDPAGQDLLVFGGQRTNNNGTIAQADAWYVLAPAVTLSPSSGPVGTTFTVTSGPGWPAGTSVAVNWENNPLKTVKAGANGMVVATVKVPGTKTGQHDVKLNNTELAIVRTATFTVTSSAPAPSAAQGPPTPPSPPSPPPAAVRYVRTPAVASGRITAHDGKFWLGSQPVLLHGVNAAAVDTPLITDADFARIASWNMNFVRMRVHWANFEPDPPTKNGDGTWTHHWDPYRKYVQRLEDSIARAAAHGQYVLLENPLISNWPLWLHQRKYNSHGKDYTDQVKFDTDFWSDPLMQQFTEDWERFLAGLTKDLPGVAGYEPLDEPNPGTLALTTANENMMLGVQLRLAKAIRSVDPDGVIFFSTHDSLGGGLPKVDLGPWQALGNVAFDVHDYFGGRWGTCLDLRPGPTFGEVNGVLLGFTLDRSSPPYLGNTVVQRRFTQAYLSYLTPKGIPLLIGEFGGREGVEPNMMGLMGTDTAAFNSLGVSWAAWTYESMLKPDGTVQPWVPVLAAAA